MKQIEQDLIRKDGDALASEIKDARCGLKEAEQPDKTGIGIEDLSESGRRGLNCCTLSGCGLFFAGLFVSWGFTPG